MAQQPQQDNDALEKNLMRHVKSDLVDLLMQSKQIEDELHQVIADYDAQLSEVKASKEYIQTKYEELDSKHTELQHDFEQECDDNASIYAEQLKQIKVLKFALVGLCIAVVIAVIF